MWNAIKCLPSYLRNTRVPTMDSHHNNSLVCVQANSHVHPSIKRQDGGEALPLTEVEISDQYNF